MADLYNTTPAPANAARIAAQIQAQRIGSGVQELPAGPVTPPVQRRESLFGGFPTSPIALSLRGPGENLSLFTLGV